MNKDGSLNFDTKIDSSGFEKGLSAINKAFNKISSLFSVTAKIIGSVSAAVGAVGTAAVKAGSQFEASMSNVQAISGATGEELEQLTNKAKEMGASTKFSASESADAFSYMAMAGWKTADMLDGIEGIMNLAAASGEDLALTSDIVTDALTAFGLSAADSTRFADILASASSNANTNVSLLGETFKYVAPLAGSLGYSAEDTATAIGLMANAGIKGSQAGTALRSILTRLAKPTDESSTAMKALGLSITDESGKMKSLSEIVKDMRKGFAGLTEDEKAAYAAMLGGQEAMSGLLAVVNASDADFEKLSGAINNCNGAAEKMAEIMNDNLQGQVTILKSGLEGLGISLYENMQEPLKNIVKEAQNMVNQMQEAFNENGFSGMVDAVGDILADVVKKLMDTAPDLIEMAESLCSTFISSIMEHAGEFSQSGASLITSFLTAVLSVSGEMWSAAVILASGLISGLAGQAPQMIKTAVSCITAIIESVISELPNFIEAGVQILQALATGIAETLPVLMKQAVSLITIIAGKIIENLPVMIECAIQIVQAFIDGLVSVFPQLLEGAVQLFNSIVEAIPVIIERLLQVLPEIVNTVITFLWEQYHRL